MIPWINQPLVAIMYTVIVVVLSGVTATFVSHYLHRRYEGRREKLAVLKQLMANRYALSENAKRDSTARHEFMKALNVAFILFYDSKPVTDAIIAFKNETGNTAAKTTKLLRRMCEDLSIDTSSLDDDFFEQPFS